MSWFGQFACAIRGVMSRRASVRERVQDVHDAVVVIVPLAHQGVPSSSQIDVGWDVAIHVLPESKGPFFVVPPAVY